MTISNAPVPRRFDNLTIGRFLAALLVYLHHSTAPEMAALPNDALRNIAHNGHVGVSFFFILSGFVLAASSLHRFGTLHLGETLTFYWKRVARIVPLWLLASTPFIIKAAAESDPRLWPFVTFTQAWSGSLPVAFGLLAVAWTLSAELFFYLTFPLIAAGCARFTGWRLGPILIVAGLLLPAGGTLYYYLHPDLAMLPSSDPASSHRWLYRSPLIRAGEFVAGVGAFVLLSRRPARLPWQAHLALLLATFAAVVTVMAVREKGPFIQLMPYAPLFVILLFNAARLDQCDRSVHWRWALLLGEASFAFYLVHQFYFKLMLLPPIITAFGLPTAQVVVFVAAVCTSVGLHLLVEQPARSLLANLPERMRRRRESAQIAVGTSPPTEA